MSRLEELERRLRDEPDNLGLRVIVAGALREAGREADALELYRSVAIAYRDQGRLQQAVSVCRSILAIAPHDDGARALLATLAPARRSSMEETPLPGALPYHVADPTTASVPKLSAAELRVATGSIPRLPDDELVTTGTVERVSAPALAPAEDLAAEVETRERSPIAVTDDDVLSLPPPTVPFELPDAEDDDEDQHDEDEPDDDEPTGVPSRPGTDDELTEPRDLPRRGR